MFDEARRERCTAASSSGKDGVPPLCLFGRRCLLSLAALVSLIWLIISSLVYHISDSEYRHGLDSLTHLNLFVFGPERLSRPREGRGAEAAVSRWPRAAGGAETGTRGEGIIKRAR